MSSTNRENRENRENDPYRYGSDEIYANGVDTVLIRFGQWVVTTYGVERIDGTSSIAVASLNKNWQWLIEQERESHYDGAGDHMGLLACLEYARNYYKL